MLLSLFRVIAIDRGWGDEDARQVVDRATALTEAGSLQDDTARLWWSLFFSLLDRDDTDGYVEVSRTLSGRWPPSKRTTAPLLPEWLPRRRPSTTGPRACGDAQRCT